MAPIRTVTWRSFRICLLLLMVVDPLTWSQSVAQVWSLGFGDANAERGFGITMDSGGNVLVVGRFRGSIDFGGGALVSAGDYDIFVAKFNPAGTHLWSARFGDSMILQNRRR